MSPHYYKPTISRSSHDFRGRTLMSNPLELLPTPNVHHYYKPTISRRSRDFSSRTLMSIENFVLYKKMQVQNVPGRKSPFCNSFWLHSWTANKGKAITFYLEVRA
eukprot:TRINITY_DN5240_c1_g1_i2.p1 TRINITY_DN5240_c1_g1~~TRINITY_DN5240_c1_g1_i2.p1  ORF type:complete len:105 (+),score=6.95 TRINITY_DN5240_c1_g1_i2:470-784(+)